MFPIEQCVCTHTERVVVACELLMQERAQCCTRNAANNALRFISCDISWDNCQHAAEAWAEVTTVFGPFEFKCGW